MQKCAEFFYRSVLRRDFSVFVNSYTIDSNGAAN